jgi:hypothetical protein
MIKEIARWILKDEISETQSISLEFQKQNVLLRSELADLKIGDVLEDQYNNKYPKTDRSVYKTIADRSILLDARCFVGNQKNMKLPIFSGTDDEIVEQAQEWIIKNISYVSDQSQFATNEYWEFSYETLTRKKGDCEDGAILLYDILRANNIPSWKIRINIGYAVNPNNGSQGMHGYVTYYSQENAKWIAVDWCWFPDTGLIKDRPEYKDNAMYGDISYSFNEEYCWSTSK